MRDQLAYWLKEIEFKFDMICMRYIIFRWFSNQIHMHLLILSSRSDKTSYITSEFSWPRNPSDALFFFIFFIANSHKQQRYSICDAWKTMRTQDARTHKQTKGEECKNTIHFDMMILLLQNNRLSFRPSGTTTTCKHRFRQHLLVIFGVHMHHTHICTHEDVPHCLVWVWYSSKRLSHTIVGPYQLSTSYCMNAIFEMDEISIRKEII